jgi:hypothetical protein
MNPLGKGLIKLEEDLRDFKFGTVFGSQPLPPAQPFQVSPIPPIILNQYDLDFCFGFSSSQVATDFELASISLVNYLNNKKQSSTLQARATLAVQNNLVANTTDYINLAVAGKNGSINLQLLQILIIQNGDYNDPLYQVAKSMQERNDWQDEGCDLRSTCQSFIDYGSILHNQSPFTYGTGKPTDQNRNFLANWANWPKALDTLAETRKLGSFYSITGSYDAFGNIMAALWHNTQNGGSEVLMGVNWRDEWTFAPGGVIEDNYTTSAGDGHCIRIIGQIVIEGVLYAIVPNTWGTTYGQNGVFYFPQNVINIEATAGYGMFCFNKLSVNQGQYLNENGLSVYENWFAQGIKVVGNLFSSLKK